VFPERKVAQYGGMPWWVILVAILLGLLLLGLLVFLLYKVRSHDSFHNLTHLGLPKPVFTFTFIQCKTDFHLYGIKYLKHKPLPLLVWFFRQKRQRT